ncbi:hypothetical protein PoB_004754700 [Plakobranchus ocellatus]|uniref:Uncharacterized protein n=1 Tax=Plakobranchus ocellatus TaxID=259542 RepID=A0AAV4BNW0_9GAST|nr:hypothetical protein PoB_004754700 [Plakobranchus ocellatus]
MFRTLNYSKQTLRVEWEYDMRKRRNEEQKAAMGSPRLEEEQFRRNGMGRLSINIIHFYRTPYNSLCRGVEAKGDKIEGVWKRGFKERGQAEGEPSLETEIQQLENMDGGKEVKGQLNEGLRRQRVRG